MRCLFPHPERITRGAGTLRRECPERPRQYAWMNMEDCTNICTICEKNNTSVIIM